MADQYQKIYSDTKHYGFGPDAMKACKVCRVCGLMHTADCQYCEECGAILPRETLFDLYKAYHLYCPVCDTVVPNNSLFCPACGKYLRMPKNK